MEFQLIYFKSWKMMLWKRCTQYASKFGKLSSGHRTGKGQFSFQSQRKAMTKNAQTTAQLHSSHMLVKLCSKFSMPVFSNTWTVNFQMFKLVLEKAEEQRPNCQHSLDHRKSKRVPEKHFCFIDYAKAELNYPTFCRDVPMKAQCLCQYLKWLIIKQWFIKVNTASWDFVSSVPFLHSTWWFSPAVNIN